MPIERPGRQLLLAILAATAVVVCCGFPVLLGAAVGVTIAGVALGIWVVGLTGGLLVAIVAWRFRIRRQHRRSACQPGRTSPEATDKTDGHRRRSRRSDSSLTPEPEAGGFGAAEHDPGTAP
jgi:hypothetical protein